MAQNREKDETLDLKVPSETPLSIPSCPDNCKKIPSSSTSSSRPDLARVGPEIADLARPKSSIDVQQDRCQSQEQKRAVEKTASLKRPASFIGPDVGPESLGLARPDVKVAVNSGKRGVNRCFGCGKRVGLTGFRCRCGDLFCGEHRYSDRHDCSYDYKSAGREAIARENPVIRAAKILKL